ncbi:DUF998 domain-containing protein [Streptomyces sp. NPDC053427]|uniref:DUF998 domain-containing protein n=1 Tax=Streptomyces sp. NPDC053427 TaxID=3365701 RepID=UPI0037D87B79
MARRWWLPLGAVVLIVNVVQWVVGEAIAAAAWTDPPYSYAANYISDLGVPDCGTTFQDRAICSPDHQLMNTSFVVQGILFAAGLILLSRVLRRRARRVVVALALAHAVGFLLVGLFHGSQDGADYGLALHMVGATVAILSANTAVIMSGRLRRSLDIQLPSVYRLFSVTVGILGLLGVSLAGVSASTAGVFERASVYSWLLWSVVTGVLILARTVRRAAVVENVPA